MTRPGRSTAQGSALGSAQESALKRPARLRWPTTGARWAPLRFTGNPRIAVALIQHECNSFARHPTDLDAFTIARGDAALAAAGGSNTEFSGALDELSARGAIAEALIWAHALPSGPLEPGAAEALTTLFDTALEHHLPFDGLVLCLHGAATTVDGHSLDTALVELARQRLGPDTAIAVTLDLHANLTPRLGAGVDVLTGYRTNPHVDQAETGRRAVELLCATMTGHLVPTLATATCPALFPDETLRLPDGILAEVLEPELASLPAGIVDLSVFPTQPWLDAPGIGFSVAALGDDDPATAAAVAQRICHAVWRQRERFEVPHLVAPSDALDIAQTTTTRPVIITEAADAPTAGATGDGSAMVAAVLNSEHPLRTLATICDPAAVQRCRLHHEGPATGTLEMAVGAGLDDRWQQPVTIEATVVSIGDGPYRLSGAGYTEMAVSMGAFAVVTTGRIDAPSDAGPDTGPETETRPARRLTLLITERPAWSADPATWAHAGLDPDDFDVVVVRSCSDYLANYPTAPETALIADVMGAASPRLERYRYHLADVVPYPVDPNAVFDPPAHLL